MMSSSTKSLVDNRKGHQMSDAVFTPKALAEEIGIDPKTLRGYLRKAHTRVAEAKNTTWLIPADVADEARAHFEAKKAAKAPQA